MMSVKSQLPGEVRWFTTIIDILALSAYHVPVTAWRLGYTNLKKVKNFQDMLIWERWRLEGSLNPESLFTNPGSDG